jgi:hypothetical protein
MAAARPASRVRRLLTQTKEDSIMKKHIAAAVAVVLLLAGIVGIQLAAQERADLPKAAGVAARNAQRAAKQKAMIDAAKMAYEGVRENHNLGRTTSNNEVYVWSNHIRTSQVRAADSPKQVIQACQDHLARMQDLHGRVVALGREGAPGGEMHKQAAAQFYVAEAELLLLDAKK